MFNNIHNLAIKQSKKIMFLSIFLVCVCFITGCASEESSARQRITEITNIEVPSNSSMVYHHLDDVFANGRRAQYTVFILESESDNWLREIDFLDGRDIENEKYFLNYFSFLELEIEKIPVQYIPNFEKTHLWIRIQNVYFFYYPNNFMLMVFIAGS